MQLHVLSKVGPLHAGSCGLKLQREQLLHASWRETDWSLCDGLRHVPQVRLHPVQASNYCSRFCVMVKQSEKQGSCIKVWFNSKCLPGVVCLSVFYCQHCNLYTNRITSCCGCCSIKGCAGLQLSHNHVCTRMICRAKIGELKRGLQIQRVPRVE